ncbi:N-acyl homoserine lactonase family protein [Rathayibacter sp. VKM Ac-2929]|uniref:N-acyl homoserine lactonase family protein n=1 Tax=Rathayibacter sp. VKM Ac-2929 TaxID=2929480 RepID=UPI001FB41FE5|nr:N-acyl homoserine lactonase family protein [Rathayibacter sp. VKM Ac-2929]MCJ1673852.1 N-acyl homoserine lactonase family protein [Rathayibacter sp. VKM Ac-2929]
MIADDWPGALPLGRPRRLVPLVLGHEPIAESISLRGGDPARFLLEPVTGAAIDLGDSWILIDGGFHLDRVRDPAQRAAHYDYESYTAVVPPGDALAEQVAAAGLRWEDLALVALSHLHLDHTGGLRLAPAGTPVALQRREWEWLGEGLGRRETVVPQDLLDADVRVLLLDGDTELAPGVSALDTRGHTPGHQSFRIDLADRSIVLACDAADLQRNLDERTPCGWTARPSDADAAQRSIERLADLAAQHGVDGRPVEVWPGHDPDQPAWCDFLGVR